MTIQNIVMKKFFFAHRALIFKLVNLFQMWYQFSFIRKSLVNFFTVLCSLLAYHVRIRTAQYFLFIDFQTRLFVLSLLPISKWDWNFCISSISQSNQMPLFKLSTIKVLSLILYKCLRTNLQQLQGTPFLCVANYVNLVQFFARTALATFVSVSP